jgi:hypothetical protein
MPKMAEKHDFLTIRTVEVCKKLMIGRKIRSFVTF